MVRTYPREMGNGFKAPARAFVWLLAMAAVVPGCITGPGAELDIAPPGAEHGFVPITTGKEEGVLPAVMHVPPAYTPEREWPLIVYLHGAGERGTNNERQVRVGIGPSIYAHPEWFDECLVLMPQSPKGAVWTVRDSKRLKNAPDVEAELDATIAHAVDQFSVDPDRVTLTGSSMGGYATWSYGADHAGKFAALAPVCGGGFPRDAERLAQLPIWAHHGEHDLLVAPEKSREMVTAVREAGGNVKFTLHENTGHNAWDKVYNDPEVIRWLLEQER